MTRLFSSLAMAMGLLTMAVAPVPGLAVESTANNRPVATVRVQHHVAKRRHRRAVRKTIKRVGIGAAGGAVAGAAIGGGPGAVVGAVAGAGAGVIYDQHQKDKGR